MPFFSWQEFLNLFLTLRCIQVITPAKQLPPPQPPPPTRTACVKKLLPTPGHLRPTLWLYLCDRTTQGEWAGPAGAGAKQSLAELQPCLGHRRLLCVRSTATSRVCCKLEVHVQKLRIFSPWQRHKRGWRRERGMEKNLMLF